MAELLYQTRGGKSPQGLQKVFFACHPSDHAAYFDEVAEELLALHDVALFYQASEEATGVAEQELAHMQLLVIPVTSRLLREPNAARERLLPVAVSLHLPILPLMMEEGLGAEFNRLCGDLQYLDKCAVDPTALPYEEKLRRFLSAVLLGEEQVRRVRAAFDAYIFLSYRKKDRAHARDIMRLIHQNEFCRDIAIWYDEFLVPGENFNSAITAALRKSDLFALVVTPNLINEPNYVMNVEYPMAREENKPILPLIASPTDQEALAARYEGIPDGVDGSDETAVTAVLRRAVENLALGETKNDPAHLFCIGLAYLDGIDVEVDRERALSLITEAAEAGLTEAVRRLADMYEYGEGVERDLTTALALWKRLLDMQYAAYQKAPNANTAHTVYRMLEDLCEKQREQYRWQEAEHTCQRMRAHLRDITERGISFYPRIPILVPYYHALVLLAEGKQEAAEACCQEALLAAEQIKDGTADNDLLVLHELLGQSAEARGDRKTARRHYEASFACSCATETGLENHVVDLLHLFDLAMADGDTAEAQAYLDEALPLADTSLIHEKTVHAERTRSWVYDRVGQLAWQRDDLKKAEAYYQKSLEISRALYEKHGVEKDLDDTFAALDMLAELALIGGRGEEALPLYEESLAIAERLYARAKTPTARQRCLMAAKNRYTAAWRAEDAERTEVAYRYLLSLMDEVQSSPMTHGERFAIVECHRSMGDHMFFSDDRYAEARGHFSIACRHARRVAKEEGSAVSRKAEVYLGAMLGFCLFMTGHPLRAYLHLRRAVANGERLVKELGGNDAEDNLAQAYHYLAFIPGRRSSEYARRAEALWKRLRDAHPDILLYGARLDFLYESAREMDWRL